MVSHYLRLCTFRQNNNPGLSMNILNGLCNVILESSMFQISTKCFKESDKTQRYIAAVIYTKAMPL